MSGAPHLSREREVGASGLLAAFLGTFMALLDLTIVNVGLPTIQVSLSTDLTGVQWIVDSFALCLAAFMLSGGLLGDRLGRKRVYLSAAVVFGAGSVVCAFAASIGMLIAGRVVQGLAAAVIVPGALSLIGRSTTDPAVRGRRMGLWGMVASIAVVAGPLLGGALVDSAGWRWIFLVNVPMVLILLATGRAGLTESSDPEHTSFDPLGQLLGVVALGSVGYGSIEARDLTTHPTPTIVCGVVVVVSAIGFLLAERRATRPMVPLPLFRIPQFSVVNVASVALGFGANGTFFLITLYLQQVRGHSAWDTGLLLLPLTLAIIPASMLAGRLIARYGPRLPLLIGYLLTGITLGGLAFAVRDSDYLPMALLFVGCGLGQGLAIVPAPPAVLQVVPRERSGVGSAVVSAARQTGTALGFAILGTIVTAHVSHATVDRTGAYVAGLHISLLLAAAVVLAAAIALALLRRPDRPRRNDSRERATARS